MIMFYNVWGCDKYLDYELETGVACDRPRGFGAFAVFYFCSFIVFCVFLILNLFIGVVTVRRSDEITQLNPPPRRPQQAVRRRLISGLSVET